MDHIVMKALRKEPDKRYASVEQFSDDINRHLLGLPVYARRGTWKYRTEKFIKRNRVGVVIAFFISTLLMGGAYLFLQNAQRMANQEAAQRVLGFLGQLYEKPFSNKTPRDEIRQTLEAEEPRQLVKALRDQPEELIQYADTITQICQRSHLYDLTVHWRLIAHQAKELVYEPNDFRIVDSLYHYGEALREAGCFEEAADQVLKAVALKKTVTHQGGVLPSQLTHLMANIRWDQANYDAAEALFKDALKQLDSLDDQGLPALIAAMSDYAVFQNERGRKEQALSLSEQALDHCRELSDEKGGLMRAGLFQNMGNFLWHTPDFQKAEIFLRKALEIHLSRLPENDPRIASSMNDLSFVLSRTPKSPGDFSTKASHHYWHTGRNMRKTLFGENSRPFAHSIYTIANFIYDHDAIPLAAVVMKIYQAYWPDDHLKIAELHALQGELFLRSNSDYHKCRPMLVNALQILSRLATPESYVEGRIKIFLGCWFVIEKYHQAGEALIAEGLRIIEKALGSEHPLVGQIYLKLSKSFNGKHGFDDYEHYYLKLSEQHQKRWPFGQVFQDCDLSMDSHTSIDFEDDQMEKVLIIGHDPATFQEVYLWIYGQPYNFLWKEFKDNQNFRIRINLNPKQEICFDSALKFSYLSTQYQWIPLKIPIQWLKQGANVFTLYIAHETEWKESQPWYHNNLRVGLDLDHNEDRSWWFGGKADEGGSCCQDMTDHARMAEKPLFREAPLITEHREQGYKECNGELMILLELQ